MISPTALNRYTGSVRVRITVLAMVVFASTAIVGSMVLVGSVRRSLEDEVKADNRTALAGLAARLRMGVSVKDILVQSEGAVGYQVFGTDGALIAGSPELVAYPSSRLLVGTEKVATPAGTFTVAVASPLDGVRKTVDTVEKFLFVGIAVMVALVGGVVWLIVRRALRPVESMRTEVEEISHGTLHRRVPVPQTHDEITRLAGTMNEMLDRLESAVIRQREFVSDASHELRSPLTAMRTTLEVTRHGDETIDWDAVRADLLCGNHRMEVLVDGLLELARADDDRTPAALEPVELADVVADEVARRRTVAVRLGYVDHTAVCGRADQLGRVVRNLLDNAERYAPARVEVSVREDGDEVVLAVDDDGPGIPTADRERVFDRFARLEPDRNRDDGGAGLGLAIVKAIVERCGGGVEVDDSPLGGARVLVRLRSAEARVAASVSAVAQ
jgi:signal transduction histidine kinase